MRALAEAAREMSDWEGGRDARFSRFRGDGWQCLAPAPPLALRAALFLRAHLRALDRDVDTRISVGIGPASLPEAGDLAGGDRPGLRDLRPRARQDGPRPAARHRLGGAAARRRR